MLFTNKSSFIRGIDFRKRVSYPSIIKKATILIAKYVPKGVVRMKKKCTRFLKVKSKIYFHKSVIPKIAATFLDYDFGYM